MNKTANGVVMMDKKEYSKQRYKRNRNKIKHQTKLWKIKNNSKQIEYNRRYRLRNKDVLNRKKLEKYHKNINNYRDNCLVKDKLNNEVKYKRIQKPMACENCNKRIYLEAHHFNYNKPYDVLWLCRCCHKQEHKSSKSFIQRRARENESTKNITNRWLS